MLEHLHIPTSTWAWPGFLILKPPSLLLRVPSWPQTTIHHPRLSSTSISSLLCSVTPIGRMNCCKHIGPQHLATDQNDLGRFFFFFFNIHAPSSYTWKFNALVWGQDISIFFKSFHLVFMCSQGEERVFSSQALSLPFYFIFYWIHQFLNCPSLHLYQALLGHGLGRWVKLYYYNI